MIDAYRKKLDLAVFNKKSNKKLFNKLQKAKPGKLDKLFHTEHESVFEEIDCLSCANCCKTTSPIFRDVDIERISQHLRIKPVQLIDQHLLMDDEGDYVLKKSPCTFLNEDNTCSIYEHRPKACREYPHTDRKNMYQVLKLTSKNLEICPAVNDIVERIKKNID